MKNSRAKIMHDMPTHHGYEIAEDIIECSQSIIYVQAENRLDAQKAIMLHLLHGVRPAWIEGAAWDDRRTSVYVSSEG